MRRSTENRRIFRGTYDRYLLSRTYDASQNKCSGVSRCPYRIVNLNIKDQLLPQKVVPLLLRECILHSEHYPSITGHPGERLTYDTTSMEVFWQHMAIDVYQMVRNCAGCARNRKPAKLKQQLQLFSASETLKLIFMHIIGSLPQTKNGSVFAVTAGIYFYGYTPLTAAKKERECIRRCDDGPIVEDYMSDLFVQLDGYSHRECFLLSLDRLTRLTRSSAYEQRPSICGLVIRILR